MLKGLYDRFLQSLTTTWAVFLEKNGDPGRLFRDQFTHNMYLNAFVTLVVLAALFCWFYYYYLNGRFGNYYRWWHYLTTLFCCALLVFSVTLVTGLLTYKKFVIPTGHHIFMLSVINFIYAAALFFLLSLVIKWGSVMGKRTPF